MSGTITEFGAPGGKVKGSFDVIALIVESSPQTARRTGNFSVTRYELASWRVPGCGG